MTFTVLNSAGLSRAYAARRHPDIHTGGTEISRKPRRLARVGIRRVTQENPRHLPIN